MVPQIGEKNNMNSIHDGFCHGRASKRGMKNAKAPCDIPNP
jgi:hypothetical protein